MKLPDVWHLGFYLGAFQAEELSSMIKINDVC